MFNGHFFDLLETLAIVLQAKVWWTHVGVVLNDPKTGEKWLCEATTDLSLGGFFRRLDVRLTNSRGKFLFNFIYIYIFTCLNSRIQKDCLEETWSCLGNERC